MTNRVRAAAALCLAVLPDMTFGQGPVQPSPVVAESCRSLTYQSQNQVDYGPLTVRRIVGLVKDKDGVPVPHTCVGVFTEPGHLLASSVETDENGSFALGKVKPGRYRLVAKYDHFGVANVLLKLASWPSGGVMHNRVLVVHLISRSIDTTSYVDFRR
jgi:hypothetical protein